jgi:hypothetical protein
MYTRTSRRLVLVLLLVTARSVFAQPGGAANTLHRVDLGSLIQRVGPAEMIVKERDGAERSVAPDSKLVTIRPGDYVVAKTGAQLTKVGFASSNTGAGFQLPVTLATVGLTGTRIELGIIVRTGNGLMPRGNASQYEGQVYVGLINTLDPSPTITLPAPVQVTLAGPVEKIEPAQPKFDATNTFVPVTVTALNPRNPVELRVSTGSSISETVVPLSVLSASVSVFMSQPRIGGFGFETDDVTVQTVGLPNPNGMSVTLRLDGARGSFVPPSRLALDANGLAVAKLRSSGVSSKVVVVASLGNGATSQSTPIEYTWPLDWLAFAVIGGIIGGVIKQLTGTAKGWLATIVVSVLIGFLAAALYALGVSIIPTVPAGTGGQLVVAVMAALGSIGGVAVLPIPKP